MGKEEYVLLFNNTLSKEELEREVFRGTDVECFTRFHRICPFSYMGHKKHSYLWYRIIPAKEWETGGEL